MFNNRNRRKGVGGLAQGAVVASVVALSICAVVLICLSELPATGDQLKALEGFTPPGEYAYQRVETAPARTLVRGNDGAVIATLTDGARTAALAGPQRRFVEPTEPEVAVDTATWVRLLPQPWHPGAENDPTFPTWLEAALRDRSPDLFEIAMQYSTGAPAGSDVAGLRTRGDADFGPEAARSNGREENSDFYDYLGVPWAFPDGANQIADPEHYGDVDCSGLLRLVYGYRLGFPLLDQNTPGPGLPRRAYAIAEFGPGAVVIPDRHTRAVDYPALQPGDLLFFNIDTDDQIDHSAIYMGLDTRGHHRFFSSRALINGPTFGDAGGTSLLDDGGHYSRSFRTARRI